MANKTNQLTIKGIFDGVDNPEIEEEYLPLTKEFCFYGVTLCSTKSGSSILNVMTGEMLTYYYDKASPYVIIYGTDRKHHKITVAEVVLRCWKNYGMQHYLPSAPYHRDGDKDNNHADNLMWMPAPELKVKVLALMKLIGNKNLNIDIPWCSTEEDVDTIHDAIVKYADHDREKMNAIINEVRAKCRERWTPEFCAVYNRNSGKNDSDFLLRSSLKS